MRRDYFPQMVGLFILVIVGIIGYAVYDEYVAEKFYLRKDQWVCTASHVEYITTTTKVGDQDIPQVIPNTVCDQWTRRN